MQHLEVLSFEFCLVLVQNCKTVFDIQDFVRLLFPHKQLSLTFKALLTVSAFLFVSSSQWNSTPARPTSFFFFFHPSGCWLCLCTIGPGWKALSIFGPCSLSSIFMTVNTFNLQQASFVLLCGCFLCEYLGSPAKIQTPRFQGFFFLSLIFSPSFKEKHKVHVTYCNLLYSFQVPINSYSMSELPF